MKKSGNKDLNLRLEENALPAGFVKPACSSNWLKDFSPWAVRRKKKPNPSLTENNIFLLW